MASQQDQLSAVPLTDTTSEELHVILTQPEQFWLDAYLWCSGATRSLRRKARVYVTGALFAASFSLLACFLTLHTSFVHACSRDHDLMQSILEGVPQNVSVLLPYKIETPTNSSVPVAIGIHISSGADMSVQSSVLLASQAQTAVRSKDFIVSAEVR